MSRVIFPAGHPMVPSLNLPNMITGVTLPPTNYAHQPMVTNTVFASTAISTVQQSRALTRTSAPSSVSSSESVNIPMTAETSQ